MPVPDHRNVPQVDRLAVPVGDYHVADLADRLELIDRSYEILPRALLKPPPREIHVLRTKLAGQVLYGKSKLRHPRLIDQHLDLIFKSAAYLDGGHAGGDLKLLLDLFLCEAAQDLKVVSVRIDLRGVHGGLKPRLEARPFRFRIFFTVEAQTHYRVERRVEP